MHFVPRLRNAAKRRASRPEPLLSAEERAALIREVLISAGSVECARAWLAFYSNIGARVDGLVEYGSSEDPFRQAVPKSQPSVGRSAAPLA
jgi:hypothetical protein